MFIISVENREPISGFFLRRKLFFDSLQDVAKLLRSYANIANEMTKAGFTTEQAENIRVEVKHYEQVRDEIKLSSGDLVEMKRFEPAMRQLLDMYIHADESKKLIDFDELGLVDLIVQKGPEEVIKELPENLKKNETAVAEAIENNVRKTIVDENPVNPKYYEKMSALLDELIERRRQQAIDYQKYLQEIRELAQKVLKPAEASSDYPASINTGPKRALYDNLGEDEELVLIIDKTIQQTKKADWVGNRFKEREIINLSRMPPKGVSWTLKVMVLLKPRRNITDGLAANWKFEGQPSTQDHQEFAHQCDAPRWAHSRCSTTGTVETAIRMAVVKRIAWIKKQQVRFRINNDNPNGN